jgi:hypothetical protein
MQFEHAKLANAVPATVIQDATVKGLCYKCKEPWFPSHKKVCKLANKNQIQALPAAQAETQDIIYIHEDSDNEGEETEHPPPELQLSMHKLCSLKHSKHTFTLTPTVGSHSGIALVDSRSTTTFMTPQFAAVTNCLLSPSPRMRVIVANGEKLWTEFTCHACPYTIQGVPFLSDFKILQLTGYDVILGADWIHHCSPVTLDYKRMTLTTTLPDNQVATFHDESLPSSPDIPESYQLNKLLQQAACGAVLFHKPAAAPEQQ